MGEKYARVNGAWPEGTRDGRSIIVSSQEAVAICRKLYRFAMKRSFKGAVKITSGRRHTWIRRGVLSVNPNKDNCGGLHEIVHGMSHYCARRLYPNANPHDGRHAFLEREMIELVVSKRWHAGALKRAEREKPAVDLKAKRHGQVLARIKSWEAKRKRAETALRKLKRQDAYYRRTAMNEMAAL